MPNSDPEWQIFLSTSYTHDRYFFLHNYWFTKIFKEELDISNAFPVKEFLLKLNEIDAAVRFFTLTSSLHKMTYFLRNGCKNQRLLTT